MFPLQSKSLVLLTWLTVAASFALATVAASDRIAVSSSMFREQFRSTGGKKIAELGELTLETLPRYVADRFQLKQLEFWSLHFESRTPSYLAKLKQALADNHSRLINLQVDGPYRLGSKDERERLKSVTLVKEWIQVAQQLNCPAIRANPGPGDLAAAIRSFQELHAVAHEAGILLLTENHLGMETDPNIHMAIHRAIDQPGFKLIADFGNYPDNESRYAALTQIMPLAHIVSAKIMNIDESWRHTTFNFSRCLEITTQAGFKGVYSIEQWSPKQVPHHPEEIVDWAINEIETHLKETN